MKYKAETAAVKMAGKMNTSDAFTQFITDSLNRLLPGDWGDVSVADAADNTDDPLNAMGAYTGPDGMKIWIKQDNNIITVLFPDEYEPRFLPYPGRIFNRFFQESKMEYQVLPAGVGAVKKIHFVSSRKESHAKTW